VLSSNDQGLRTNTTMCRPIDGYKCNSDHVGAQRSVFSIGDEGKGQGKSIIWRVSFEKELLLG